MPREHTVRSCRGDAFVARSLRLDSGEAMRWQIDPGRRVTVVVPGDDSHMLRPGR